MSSVPQRDTLPEIALRRALHRLGLRFRVNVRTLPGSPDIVFPRYRAVVFVHGCFWHAHGCSRSTKPATRADFWERKFAANQERDVRKAGSLAETGWRVGIVWECSLARKGAGVETVAGAVRDWLLNASGPKDFSAT